ncbi:unnamed protein product [Callosobruchus maculatus]|uniref:Uncharacterized protein n=1 Tax=Callosobruchus maculatus TaxID=64391 RepID=A0A653CK25_CALMS|nr:unnamed protein product [Callosobruchus maculatus]
MHKKYTKNELAECDRGGERKVKKKHREHKKEKDGNQVLFLKYDPVKISDAKGETKRAKSRKSREQNEHALRKQKSEETNSDNFQEPRIGKNKNMDEREKLHNETMKAYEKYRKHIRKLERDSKISSSSLNLPKQKKAPRLRKENTIHLENPSQDMPIFKPYTALKIDEKKHKAKKLKKALEAAQEKTSRGDGDAHQKQQVLYCQIETGTPFKHTERKSSEVRVAFTEHHKRHGNKRKYSSEAISPHKSHREKTSAKHRKHVPLDEYVFNHNPKDKSDKKVTEIYHSRDQSLEPHKHRGNKSQVNIKTKKHGSASKDRSSKGTDDIKSYFEKIQAAIDRKIDTLLGPRQRHSSNELSLERKKKTRSKSKNRRRSPHKKHHSSSRGTRELSRKKSIVQSVSDSRVHLRSSDLSEKVDEETLKAYIAGRLSKKEKSESQELNKSSDSKKPSKSKTHEFKVEGVEPPNLQSKNPQKKHAHRNLECKTVSIIGIPSSIQAKSIVLNNTQTNTSLKFSNSVEDIVEKKKRSKRFKLYYKYSMDSNAVTNSLNSEEQSIVSDSYRQLTDPSDQENICTETKCDVIPIKLTFQKPEPKKTQETPTKRLPHKHRRRENLIKLNDIIEERHDTPSEQFRRGMSPNRDIHYEFFRALHSSNSEYGLSTGDNGDLFGEFNLSKHWVNPKQTDMKFFVNKSKKKQKNRWKYMSKSDVNISYHSLCDKAEKKKATFEPKPCSNQKEVPKQKRVFHYRKDKSSIENGDQAIPKKQPTVRPKSNEEENDIGTKEYLKKIYDISMEIKKKFFENSGSGRCCKDSQMFDLLCLTDPTNLFSTIESTSKTSDMRRERIRHLQSLSSNMSRGFQEANRESRVKDFDSHTHREKIYRIQSVTTNNSRSVASQEDRPLESDAQNGCTSIMTDGSRIQTQTIGSRDLSSHFDSTDNVFPKTSHSKRGSCMFGKNIKTQTLQISEVGVSTIKEDTMNQNVQTSKGNMLTTVDTGMETYGVDVDKSNQPNVGYKEYFTEIVSTVRNKKMDVETLKNYVSSGKKSPKLDKGKPQKVRSNQKCKSVFYRYRRLGNMNVLSSPSPIEQVARKEVTSKDQVKESNRVSCCKKWCHVETVYVPRNDSETMQEDGNFVPCKQYISKEIISVNVPPKSSTQCVVEKQSICNENEKFMAQKMIEVAPLGDPPDTSLLKKSSKSASGIEAVVNDDASSKVTSLICLQSFMNDAGFTMSSRDTSQLSDRTEPPPHTTMMLTKQYKTSDVSSYQKRKMYDNMIRKKMKKKINHSGYGPQVFEVRFMSLERQKPCNTEFSLLSNKREKIESKVMSAINRVSEIKKGMVRSGIESVFINKHKIYEFCQYLTKGDDPLFDGTYFGCKTCSCAWNLDDNVDELVNFLRKSISLFYKCGCNADNGASLENRNNDIYKEGRSGEEHFIEYEEFYDDDRETTSTVQTDKGLASRTSNESGYTSIKSEQSAGDFFKKPSIAALMRPPSELQQKRSKLFRSDISDTEMANYNQMARQCQEYAHKVRCYDPSWANQNFEEIPLNVLLSRKSLVSVESCTSNLSCCPQFFGDRNLIADSGLSRTNSAISVSPDVGNLSTIPSTDSMDSCLESASILHQILGNKVVLSSTNLNSGCITLMDKMDNLAKPFLRAPTTKEKRKIVVKNFFDNLLCLYEKEIALGYALSNDNHFFENELLTLIRNDASGSAIKRKKRKGVGHFFTKMFGAKKMLAAPQAEALRTAIVSEKAGKLEDDHQKMLQFLARSTRKYFSPFVEAVKMNRDIDDEMKICGFLKLLDMIEKGQFTFFWQQNNQSEVDFEQEIRNQVKATFTNVYRVAKLTAKQSNRILTQDDIDLLRALVCKYRIGLLSSIDIIAKLIGKGYLRSEDELKCKFLTSIVL